METKQEQAQIRTESTPLISQAESQSNEVNVPRWSFKKLVWENKYIILDFLLFMLVAYGLFYKFYATNPSICIAEKPYQLNSTFEFSTKDYSELRVILAGNALPSIIEFRQEAINNIQFDIDITTSSKLLPNDIHIKNPRLDGIYTVDIVGAKEFNSGCYKANIVVKLPKDLNKFRQIFVNLPSGSIVSKLNMYPNLENLDLRIGSGSILVANMQSDKFRLITGSGNIYINDVNATEVYLHTGSGNIKAVKIESQDVSISSGSGNLELDFSTANNIVMRSGSGSITTKHVTSSIFSTSAASGNVDLTFASLNELKARAGSGDLKAVLDNLGDLKNNTLHKFNLLANSGDIALTLPAKFSGHFLAQSDSGKASITVPYNRTDFIMLKDTKSVKEGYHIDKLSLNSINLIANSGDAAVDFV